METVYWTKHKMEIDEETGIITHLEELETIHEETELGFVPDGDGFEVDMNGIKYSTYLKNPNNYEIVEGKLIKK